MNSIICTTDGTTPVRELLDMIARCAPTLMRIGGLVENSGEIRMSRPVTGDLVNQWVDALNRGQTFAEIAAMSGYSVETVKRRTRPFRPHKTINRHKILSTK